MKEEKKVVKKAKVRFFNQAHYCILTKRYVVLNDMDVKGVPCATIEERLYLAENCAFLFEKIN